MKYCIVILLIFFNLRLSVCQTPDYSGKPDGHDSTSFIFVGDLQLRGPTEIGREDNRNAVGAILKKIADENPSFVLILGDLTWNGGVNRLWCDFDSLALPIYQKQIPAFVLPGNHEYIGDEHPTLTERVIRGYKSDTDWMNEYFSRFPTTGNRLWYSKKWNTIGIITLNSNFDHLTRKEIANEIKWYKSELSHFQSDPGISIIIVACHQPPYTNGKGIGFPDSDDENAKKYFVKQYIATPKAKLFISGHCHSYEHLKISGKDFIVSGGGGPRRKVKLQPISSPMHDLSNLPELRQHHYCKFIPKSDSMLVQRIQVGDDLNTWSVGEEITIK